jgi:tricorn protease
MQRRNAAVAGAIVTLALMAVGITGSCLAAEGYLNFPDIRGNTIVFTCDGDLWSVSADGGLARRLTHAEGREFMARFSPDGEHIAFTGQLDQGGRDVYLIPASGGPAKRLTYHPYSDYVLTWAPDGENIVFRSMRGSPHYTYKVFTISMEGGFPQEIPLDEISLISFAPDGRRVAFNRFSREFRTWKRYRGGLAQDIWVGDPETLDFSQITDYEGTDAFPMWVGGRIYFISDRNATMNIHSMNPDGSDVRQHTFHEDYDVRWPSTDDDRIVYHNGGDIWMFDIASGDYGKVDIQVPSGRLEERERFIEPAEHVTDFEVSPKAKRAAFCSRGELAVIPVEEGRTIALTATSGIREKFPRWSPDGKKIAYVSEATGEEEIYIVEVNGKSEPEQITRDTQGWKFHPAWSPDGEKIAYADGSQTLFVLDCGTGRITRADSSDYWEIEEYSWSPDGRWIAYSKYEDHRFNSIFLYDTETGEVTRLTDKFTNDTNPVWDPDGKYLYFLSDRTINPVLGKIAFDTIVDKMEKPYLIVLQAGEKSPFFPGEPDEGEEEDEDENDKEAKGKHGKAKDEEDGDEEEAKETVIDLEGIMDRFVEFPVEAGHYSELAASEGKIFYRSRPSLGLAEGSRRGAESQSIHSIHMFDIEEEEGEVIVSGINSFRLSRDGKKIIYKRINEYFVVDAGKGAGDAGDDSKVDMSQWHIRLDPSSEWAQIFNEGWRLQRDFYWAPDMAGIDWDGVRAKYAKLLPRISTRHDLNDLLGEMIAELSTSHTYIWGGDLRDPERIQVGLLGVDIEPHEMSGYYRITKIYPPEPSSPDAVSPLMLSHTDVKEGEYIIAVNGKPLQLPANFYSVFVNLSGDEVLLTVNDRPSREGARDVKVKTVGGDSDLRYLEWVRSKREFVDEQTGGRVGYIHIPDMSTSGLIEFQRTFYPQIERPGLIVDARYNAGGFVSDLILRRLAVGPLAYGKPRKGKPYLYPDDAVIAHMVALCNQHAGSDGDIFPRAFKLAELGPVIGMRTWGGVVGIRMDKRFVDGGMMTIPEFAWWEEGGWTLENKGVEPDIEVENLPGEVLRGRDAQLETAIEVVMEELERDPRRTPELPPYPDKSKQ